MYVHMCVCVRVCDAQVTPKEARGTARMRDTSYDNARVCVHVCYVCAYVCVCVRVCNAQVTPKEARGMHAQPGC